jgi:hypothetical protein
MARKRSKSSNRLFVSLGKMTRNQQSAIESQKSTFLRSRRSITFCCSVRCLLAKPFGVSAEFWGAVAAATW